MWSQGKENGYSHWVKHYDTGSEFGIDGGRISKLQISRDGLTVVSYERGRDVEPKSGEDKAFFDKLVKKYI